MIETTRDDSDAAMLGKEMYVKSIAKDTKTKDDGKHKAAIYKFYKCTEGALMLDQNIESNTTKS